MTSTMTNQLEEWGSHCSLSTCHALDFLPFKCQHCSKLFCSDHFKPSVRPSEHSHQCSVYDESMIDARVPSCPLCGDPISIPANTDPNIPMDAHLTNACRLLDRSGLLSTHRPPPVKPSPDRKKCARPRCSNKMLVPMICKVCERSYCASHRLGPDHACPGPPQGSTKSQWASLLALKAAMSSVPTSSRQSSSQSVDRTQDIKSASSSPAPREPGPGPVDRYRLNKKIKAEEESRRKALEWRAQKGLLSADEKVIYANLKAESQKKFKPEGLQASSTSKDCVIC